MSGETQLSLPTRGSEQESPNVRGNLPDGWAEASLPELIAPTGVLTDGDWVESKDQDPNGDVRLTQLADVGDGAFRDRSSRFLTSSKATELRCTYLRPGDVMIARMPDPLGRACVFPGSPMPCVTVVDVCIVRPGTTEIDSRWLRSFINSPGFRLAVASLQRGSTRKRISKKNLSGIALPVPPSHEQKRLADEIESYLSRLDDVVATLERVQRNLKRYRASVLKAAVEGRLVPTEAELARQEGRDYEPAEVLLQRILDERKARWIEDAGEKARARAESKAKKAGKPWSKSDDEAALEKGRKAAAKKYQPPEPPDTSEVSELPEGWCWTTVDAVGDVLLGRQRAPQYLTGKYSRPYLRVANIKDDQIDFTDVKEMDFDEEHFEKYSLCQGDILVSEGQSPELVGQSAIYRGGVPELCFQKTLHRFRSVPGGPAPEFAQVVFRAHVKNEVFKKVASITTNIAHLTLIKFKASRFPLPPADEQERIATEVARLLSVADATDTQVASQLARLHRLRQSILKWAFEGRLVDQDPSDEPASVLLERIAAEREKAEANGGKKKRRTKSRKKKTA